MLSTSRRRPDVAPQAEGRPLRLKISWIRPLVELLEQLLLEPVTKAFELLDHRKVGIHRLVDDVVHRHLGTRASRSGLRKSRSRAASAAHSTAWHAR